MTLTGASDRRLARPMPDAGRLRRLEMLEKLLDRRFRVLGVPIGLDGVIGLVPGAGDTVTALLSSYIVYEAWQLGASRSVLARMVGNIALDYVLGLVPVVGDVADFFHKSNTRNLRLLKQELGYGQAATGPFVRSR